MAEFERVSLHEAGSTVDKEAVWSCMFDALSEDYNATLHEIKFKEIINTITEPLLAHGPNDNVVNDLEVYLDIVHIEVYKKLKELGFYKLGRMLHEFDKSISTDAIVLRRT
jgi:hypothetical protein